MLLTLPLFILLGVISIFDFLNKRISNYLVMIGLIYGLLLAVLGLGQTSFSNAIFGIFVGGGMFLFPYAKSYVGAGDLKLMAMAGAYLGPYLAFLAVLYSAIFGGIAILIYLLYQRVVSASSGEGISPNSGKTYAPYAFAISLGAIFALLKPNFL